jgi:hypothetical protein
MYVERMDAFLSPLFFVQSEFANQSEEVPTQTQSRPTQPPVRVPTALRETENPLSLPRATKECPLVPRNILTAPSALLYPYITAATSRIKHKKRPQKQPPL